MLKLIPDTSHLKCSRQVGLVQDERLCDVAQPEVQNQVEIYKFRGRIRQTASHVLLTISDKVEAEPKASGLFETNLEHPGV